MLTISLILWSILLVLPWLPWSVRERLDSKQSHTNMNLSDVTVVIPARNEASVIATTLASVELQGYGHKIILVDDGSDDGTREQAEAMELDNLQIINSEPLPDGWSGKLWAQNQAVELVDTSLTLLIDADIRLDAGILSELKTQMRKERVDFISLMAAPPLFSFWEKVLMPAFVYFFKLLYPFALSNRPSSFVAAAAGGCILVRTEAFKEIGGLHVIKGALIDDCSFAKKVKEAGFKTWTGVTNSVHSQRPYAGLMEIWNMVARTAFTQLFYSTILLILCIAIMALMFVMPVLGMICPEYQKLSLITLGLMFVSYMPTVKYYHLNLMWVLALPFAAVLYMAMTVTSALRYWRGEKSRWKGRVYQA